jgi:glycine/serine hydroxymethyltransferase
MKKKLVWIRDYIFQPLILVLLVFGLYLTITQEYEKYRVKQIVTYSYIVNNNTYIYNYDIVHKLFSLKDPKFVNDGDSIWIKYYTKNPAISIIADETLFE